MSSLFKIPFYVKASLISIGMFAFISVIYISRGIIIPIIYSIIIAVILTPIIDFLVRKGINRLVAISFTVSIMVVASVSIIALLSSQASMFIQSFPKLITQLDELVFQTGLWLANNFNISPFVIHELTIDANAEVSNGLRSMIGPTLINIGNVLVVLFLIPVYVFMILFYQPLLIEFIHRLFSINKLETVNTVLAATKRIIQSYLVGLLLEALIVAVLNSASLLILGIEYAILLGVIGAILNVIPYIGGVVAVALPMLIALSTKSPVYALLVLVAYIIIQFIDNNYIMPKVVASKVQVNALVSIVVVLVGGALWGIPGMFLSIPLTAILKVIFDHIDSLKPLGYLIGDTMPPFLGIKLPFKKKVNLEIN
jgi:predicted PurR-regulated permease PerM